MNFEFLKITAPIVFNQRFEPGTYGSESQCYSTAPSWDNAVNAKGRANEIGQSWCPADLFDTRRYQSEATYRPYADTCSMAAAIHTLVLFTLSPHWSILYSML